MSTPELDIRTVEDPDSLVAWPAGQPYLSCELAAGELLSAYSTTQAGQIVAVCFVKDSSNMRDQPWATVVGQPSQLLWGTIRPEPDQRTNNLADPGG